MNDFIIYESKISLQLMETLKIVVDIVEEDKAWKCCHKTSMTWSNQNHLYIFKNSFGDPYPLYKYDISKFLKSILFKLYNLLYMDVIFINLHSYYYYYSTSQSLTLIMLSIKNYNFQKTLWQKSHFKK